jgi:hypothetical protein
MPYTRDMLRASVERAGDAHWQALIAHHESAYPAAAPTPGDVCRGEAERLNALGLTAPGYELLESRVRREGRAVELTHRLRDTATGAELWTPPYRDYEADAPPDDAG